MSHRNALSNTRLRIIVGGFLGLLPAGGVTWDYIQYPVGFASLGHDVYYIEDTRLWPVFQTGAAQQIDCSDNVKYLSKAMDAFGLSGRWAYRDEVSGECLGLCSAEVSEICRTADLFVNVSCSTILRDEYLRIPKRALIDSDPMFTQIQMLTQARLTTGEGRLQHFVEAHTHHFTFGENVGSPGCRIPECGITWLPTRQPICIDHWPVTALPDTSRSAYTTVMNWSATRPLEFEGDTWGQKDVELNKLWDLPSAVPEIPLTVVVGQTGGSPFPAASARDHGWTVADPRVCAPDWDKYRQFIQDSRGEFSVAKETYVKAMTGWFSCRAACYLASGRPAITQDTGWSSIFPTGEGLLAFCDRNTAVEALRCVEADPKRHARAAREIAMHYFDAQVVLSKLLAAVGGTSANI